MIYLLLFLTFIILNIIDVMLTRKLLSLGGRECNPFIRYLINRTPYWGVYKVTGVSIVVAILSYILYITDHKTLTLILLIAINLFYICIIIHNKHQLRLQS